MEIPKEIDDLLEKRARLAGDFLDCDGKIADWLESHNIVVPMDDIRTGACSICEPYASIENIRNCIRDS